MGSVPPLLSFLLMIAAGWVHRHQLIVIEFLQAENRLLKGRLRGRRIRFTDAERALLARKAKAVGRKALLELDTIVSPDTLLRWHRRLVAHDRLVEIAGITTRPDESWMLKMARNLADSEDGPLRAKKVFDHRSRYQVHGSISSADS